MCVHKWQAHTSVSCLSAYIMSLTCCGTLGSPGALNDLPAAVDEKNDAGWGGGLSFVEFMRGN